MKRLVVSALVLLGILSAVGVRAQATLADVLASTEREAGPAPGKFDTPFLVVRVNPFRGRECALEVVTNGAIYSLSGNRDDGECDHLPPLHALVWGRVRHSRLATFLRQNDVAKTASDYVDLVYAGSQNPKVAFYVILDGEEIGPDWGR
ncbi:MAG: hypothetical protein WA708_13220 [Acidobacteriaceae bacterium]